MPHERLLLKLHHYGVRGSILLWIRDFLSHRTQAVVLEGKTSTSAPVTSGVPQGTVLGPLLFLVYINDMPLHAQSKTRLFADDCLMYRSVKTAADCEQLQSDIDGLQEWEAIWQMECNPQKCEALSITNRRKPLQHTYSSHTQTLQHVDQAKYLGLIISNKLSWNQHTDTVTKKANSTLAFLRRNISAFPVKAKEKAYMTYVKPSLEYAASIWDPHIQRNINAVERVQRRAARFVQNQYQQTSSVTALLEQLQWPTLQLRRQQAKIIMLHRIIHNFVDIPNLLILTGIFTRGHNHRFLQPHCRTKTFQHSFFPSAIRLWNALPQTLALIEEPIPFQQALLNPSAPQH